MTSFAAFAVDSIIPTVPPYYLPNCNRFRIPQISCNTIPATKIKLGEIILTPVIGLKKRPQKKKKPLSVANTISSLINGKRRKKHITISR